MGHLRLFTVPELMLGQGEDAQVRGRANVSGLFLEDYNVLDHDSSFVRSQVEPDPVVSRNDIVWDECELVVLEIGWRNKRLTQPNVVPIVLMDGPKQNYGARVR